MFGDCAMYLIKVLFYKIIGSGFIIFAVFNQRHPKRAGLLVNFNIGEKVVYLKQVRSGLHVPFVPSTPISFVLV